MKIKILKDIPGYKAGEILERSEGSLGLHMFTGRQREIAHYDYEWLIERGWAEVVKDEIDMEEIRNKYRNEFGDIDHSLSSDTAKYFIKTQFILEEEWKFFKSYRIVKAVIEKLNGEQPGKWDIVDYQSGPRFAALFYDAQRHNILPQTATSEIAVKVIELCKPELEVLFGVKKI